MRLTIVAAIAAVMGILFSEGAMAGDLSPAANQAYLVANAAKQGVVTRPSGLQYRVIKSGTGRTPKTTDDVLASYKGSLVDGTVFDRTNPGETTKFTVGKVIPGWTEALTLMKEGDEWELVIPSNLGYGERGYPGAIPPNQTLVFDVTLVKV